MNGCTATPSGSMLNFVRSREFLYIPYAGIWNIAILVATCIVKGRDLFSNHHLDECVGSTSLRKNQKASQRQVCMK